MVEVFKTDVSDQERAKAIVKRLAVIMPSARISFDLEDCDRILRIEDGTVPVASVKKIAGEMGFECQQLD